jgi:hypothetical protein
MSETGTHASGAKSVIASIKGSIANLSRKISGSGMRSAQHDIGGRFERIGGSHDNQGSIAPSQEGLFSPQEAADPFPGLDSVGAYSSDGVPLTLLAELSAVTRATSDKVDATLEGVLAQAEVAEAHSDMISDLKAQITRIEDCVGDNYRSLARIEDYIKALQTTPIRSIAPAGKKGLDTAQGPVSVSDQGKGKDKEHAPEAAKSSTVSYRELLLSRKRKAKEDKSATTSAAK